VSDCEVAAYAGPMRLLAALLAGLVLAACGQGGTSDATGNGSAPDRTRAPADASPEPGPSPGRGELAAMPPFETARVALVDRGGQRFEMPVYVADDQATRQQGLMGVTDLPREAGMVFVFPEDRRGGFWMKNTLLPLSIAFFAADGEVLAVLDMEPCEADPCPSYDPGVTYRGALEVNKGRFDELGLATAGWTVELPPDR